MSIIMADAIIIKTNVAIIFWQLTLYLPLGRKQSTLSIPSPVYFYLCVCLIPSSISLSLSHFVYISVLILANLKWVCSLYCLGLFFSLSLWFLNSLSISPSRTLLGEAKRQSIIYLLLSVRLSIYLFTLERSIFSVPIFSWQKLMFSVLH